MRRCYGLFTVAFVFALTAFSAAQATELLPVGAVGPPDGNCIGLQQVGAASIELTPGTLYTVSVAGDARANILEGGEYDGLFVYYFDYMDPFHPVTYFLAVGEEYQFVAGDLPFYAYLVDKTLKDVADNTGSFTLTFEAISRDVPREELEVGAVFNCIGLQDAGAAMIILTPEHFYVASISGAAGTNSEPSGYFDGVCMFYRRIDEDPPRPIHPILEVLEYGEEIDFQIHVTGWVYAFFPDESYFTMGSNWGKITIAFEEETPVEHETWGRIKGFYR